MRNTRKHSHICSFSPFFCYLFRRIAVDAPVFRSTSSRPLRTFFFRFIRAARRLSTIWGIQYVLSSHSTLSRPHSTFYRPTVRSFVPSVHSLVPTVRSLISTVCSLVPQYVLSSPQYVLSSTQYVLSSTQHVHSTFVRLSQYGISLWIPPRPWAVRRRGRREAHRHGCAPAVLTVITAGRRAPTIQ